MWSVKSVGVLLAFILQAPAKDSVANLTADAPRFADMLVNKLVSKFFDRAQEPSSHHADLESTTFAKPNHLAISPGVSPRPFSTPSTRPYGDCVVFFSAERLSAISQMSVRRNLLNTLKKKRRKDSASAQAHHRLQFQMEARLGQSPLAHLLPQLHRKMASGHRNRHIKTYAIPDVNVLTDFYQLVELKSTYAIPDKNMLTDFYQLALPADYASRLVDTIREAPSSFFEWYDNCALEYPLRTKATTSGFCYGLGDLCAQSVAGKNLSTVDLGRTARSGAAGFVGHGPVAHYWIAFLEKYLSFGGAWYAVPAKVIANQPMNLVYNTVYSFVIGTLALRAPGEIWRDVKAAAIPAFWASLKFWPFVNLVTFGLVPIELRVAWVDTVKVVWITILSRINNEKIRAEAAAAKGSGAIPTPSPASKTG